MGRSRCGWVGVDVGVCVGRSVWGWVWVGMGVSG